MASLETNSNSPFHPGEQSVQIRAGVRDAAENLGQKMIRDLMPMQHQEFYEDLPYLFAGHVDANN